MTCSGIFGATSQLFNDFWCVGDSTCMEERDRIEDALNVAASDIHAALASVGACDCSLASWARGYLQKLVIIDAAAYYNCPCGNPRLTDARKELMLNWMSTQLQNITTGVIDVCDGATGSNWPAIGHAQQGVSEFAKAQIIYNDILRNS